MSDELLKKENFFDFFRTYFEKGFNKVILDEEIKHYWDTLYSLPLEKISTACKELFRRNRLVIASPALILHELECNINKPTQNEHNILSPNTCYISGCLLESKSKVGTDKNGKEVFLCNIHEDEYWLAEKVVRFGSKLNELGEIRNNATESFNIFVNHWDKFMRKTYGTNV